MNPDIHKGSYKYVYLYRDKGRTLMNHVMANSFHQAVQKALDLTGEMPVSIGRSGLNLQDVEMRDVRQVQQFEVQGIDY